MKMRGRNRKWFGTGNRRAIWVVGIDVVCQFGPGIACVWGGMDAFVVIDVVERCAQVSHHECVGGENRGGNGRRSVNGRREQTVGNWRWTSSSSMLRRQAMCSIICLWGSASSSLVGLFGGGEVMM